MMSNDEKFDMYFFNEMNAKEKQSFEDEIKSSKQMEEDFDRYKKVFALVHDSKNIKLDALYTQTIIPNFRNRLEKKKKLSILVKYGYAFAVLFIAVIGYSIITNVMNEKHNLQQIYTRLTNDEVNSLVSEMNIDAENYYDENAIEKIDSIYNIELVKDVNASLYDNSIESGYKDINIKELDQYLSDRDIDLIFAELSKKEII